MELELDDGADGGLDGVGEVLKRTVGVGDGDDLDNELAGGWSHGGSGGWCGGLLASEERLLADGRATETVDVDRFSR